MTRPRSVRCWLRLHSRCPGIWYTAEISHGWTLAVCRCPCHLKR